MNDYSARDKDGSVVFYVLLWKRRGISLDLYDDYWRNVHGPVCARLPGQFQYWQLHVAHNEGGMWPQIPGIRYDCSEGSQFDGIAELTFKSDGDRTTWFQAAGILMDDEHNLFSKAIGYNTSEGNSRTYVDRIAMGAPNGPVGVPKFHVMVKKTAGVSVEAFRNYLTMTFAPTMAASDLVLKFRMHLFEEVDASRPDAAGWRTASLPRKVTRLPLRSLSPIISPWRLSSNRRHTPPPLRNSRISFNKSAPFPNGACTHLCMTAG